MISSVLSSSCEQFVSCELWLSSWLVSCDISLDCCSSLHSNKNWTHPWTLAISVFLTIGNLRAPTVSVFTLAIIRIVSKCKSIFSLKKQDMHLKCVRLLGWLLTGDNWWYIQSCIRGYWYQGDSCQWYIGTDTHMALVRLIIHVPLELSLGNPCLIPPGKHSHTNTVMYGVTDLRCTTHYMWSTSSTAVTSLV